MRKSFVPLLIPFLVTWLLSTAGQTDQSRHQLAPGVDLVQEVIAGPEGPLTINVLRIDPKRPGVRVESALAKDVMLDNDPTKGRETVAALCVRRSALAAAEWHSF